MPVRVAGHAALEVTIRRGDDVKRIVALPPGMAG